MTLTFISNFINHHQVYLADEFYRILGDDYKFIETMPMPQWLIDSGYPTINRPYIINGYTSSELIDKALKIAYDSDVVVIGSASDAFVITRIKENKITFRYSERFFKSKPWYMTGPRGWINLYRNHIRFRNNPLYMLCASAYTAGDVNRLGAYKNKCFKWGYFTTVDRSVIEVRAAMQSDIVHFMWCARFLRLKHPELPVKLAARLKRKGYRFVIDMFGCGEDLQNTIELAKQLDVEDVVRFCGNRPNDEILSEMQKHDIFLFTSDRNEGWGAVLNEAMSCGCVVVGSNQIGAVPFLIEDGVNGLVFKSENLNSLEEKVLELLNNPIKCKEMSKRARRTMSEVWSPQNAARSFLLLIEALNTKDYSKIPMVGPCSIA